MDFKIEDVDELKERLKSLTGYGDSVDENTYDSQIQTAMLRLYNKTGRDDFFDHQGLAQALLGYSAMLTTSSVENISMSRYSIGDEEVEFAGGSSSMEDMGFWAELVAEGLRAAGIREKKMRNTSSYIQGQKPRYRRWNDTREGRFGRYYR